MFMTACKINFSSFIIKKTGLSTSNDENTLTLLLLNSDNVQVKSVKVQHLISFPFHAQM